LELVNRNILVSRAKGREGNGIVQVVLPEGKESLGKYIFTQGKAVHPSSPERDSTYY